MTVSRRPAAGFTLVEAVVSLAIVGMLLLLAALTLAEQRRAQVAVDHHREALGAMERTLELVRSGLLPLESTVLAVEGGELRLPAALERRLSSTLTGPTGESRPEPADGWAPRPFAPTLDSGSEGMAGGSEAVRHRLMVHLDVEPETGAAGLFRVRVTALRGGDPPLRRRLETLVWRGGGAP